MALPRGMNALWTKGGLMVPNAPAGPRRFTSDSSSRQL